MAADSISSSAKPCAVPCAATCWPLTWPTATWLHDFYPDSFWETPGGDFAAAESAAFTIDGGGAYTWESAPGLVADVQGWLDEPQRNFDWIILGNEVDPKTAKRIFAREHATTSRRPVLHISFDRDAATAVELDSWGAIKAE